MYFSIFEGAVFKEREMALREGWVLRWGKQERAEPDGESLNPILCII